MSEKKIAIVTGANRGIGLEICRQLSSMEGVYVILTSRDEEKGKAQANLLKEKGLNVGYHQLDVTDLTSVEALTQFIDQEFGRCDILVNNAGIFPDYGGSILDTDLDIMRKGMETNVYGPLQLTQKIIPLMQKNNYGRVVNLSSGMGQLSDMNGRCPSYRHTKTALNAVTRIFAQELEGTNIKVNCMCPGWVKTDMGGQGATRELSQGADTAIFLSTLPDDGPSGLFFRDRKVFPW